MNIVGPGKRKTLLGAPNKSRFECGIGGRVPIVGSSQQLPSLASAIAETGDAA